MEYHRSLYKSNPSNTSTQRTANEIRASKRRDLHCSARNISLSPAQINPVSQQDTQKENFKPPGKVASRVHQTDKSTEINCQSSANVEKQKRRKAFLMRYLSWKEKKQALLKEENFKKPAFVVPSGSGTGTRTVAEQGRLRKPLAPKNHVFKPPANIKDLAVQIIGSHSMRLINGVQEEIFHFIETPKKNTNSDSKVTSVKSLPTTSSKANIAKAIIVKTSDRIKKAQQTSSVAMHLNPKRTNCNSGKAPTPAAKPVPLPSKQEQSKTEKRPTKTPIRIKTNPPVQSVSKPFAKLQTNLSSATKKTVPPQKTTSIFQKPESANAIRKDTAAKQRNCKSGMPALKRPTFKAAKKTSISNTLLASKGTSQAKASVIQQVCKVNGKSALDVATKISNAIPETPTDLCPEQSYLNFVTSTKRKSSSKGSNSDQLFAELGNTISPVDDCSPAKSNHKSKSDSKFNFLRYSVVNSDKNNVEQQEEREKEVKLEEPKATPEKPNGPSPTYMSPYVSVSRGKVSSRIEREKRNSVYMVPDICSTSPQMTTAIRHTIATVHYYRKQLTDEINRLINQCTTWEQYKENNAELIADAGSDMINVTIGQTRLLTSKKLKQFGDLIDRCENGVLGKNSTVARDDEGAKPILPEDLEGFWSMVGLQIENVDKRFANLERWKSNSWTDPDDIPTKATTNAIKVKKARKTKPTPTARSNGALQKILRTAHAAYLNKKAAGETDEDVILTPSKKQVVIRDRRSRSAAATVITVNSPRVSRRSTLKDTPLTDFPKTPKLVPHINGLRKSLNLLKSTLLNEQEKKSPLLDFTSPPSSMKHSRKSILKTPGSMCKPKSVVFNSPAIKFTIDDAVDDGSVTPTGAEYDQRTYKLRNRRVILRDSSEFVIPQ